MYLFGTKAPTTISWRFDDFNPHFYKAIWFKAHKYNSAQAVKLNGWKSRVLWWFPCLSDSWLSTLRPRQNGRHFADDIFKCIFLNENVWISIKISLNFVPKDRINNIPALVQIMAWRRSGDKPLSEPMMVSLLTHICVTRPQWLKCAQCSSMAIEQMTCGDLSKS